MLSDCTDISKIKQQEWGIILKIPQDSQVSVQKKCIENRKSLSMYFCMYAAKNEEVGNLII